MTNLPGALDFLPLPGPHALPPFPQQLSPVSPLRPKAKYRRLTNLPDVLFPSSRPLWRASPPSWQQLICLRLTHPMAKDGFLTNLPGALDFLLPPAPRALPPSHPPSLYVQQLTIVNLGPCAIYNTPLNHTSLLFSLLLSFDINGRCRHRRGVHYNRTRGNFRRDLRTSYENTITIDGDGSSGNHGNRNEDKEGVCSLHYVDKLY